MCISTELLTALSATVPAEWRQHQLGQALAQAPRFFPPDGDSLPNRKLSTGSLAKDLDLEIDEFADFRFDGGGWGCHHAGPLE